MTFSQVKMYLGYMRKRYEKQNGDKKEEPKELKDPKEIEGALVKIHSHKKEE